MKKVLRQTIVTILLFTLLALPAAWPSEAAATTSINHGWFYIIQNVESGKFIEVANGNIVVGTNLWQDEFYFDSTLSQIFCLEFAESAADDSDHSDYYHILPAGDVNLCWDVNNASDSDGTNIKIFFPNPIYDAQSFCFIPNGDGTFCIQPLISSSRVLGVANNSTANQANVVLVPYDPSNVSDSQKWVMKKVRPAIDPDYYAMNWSYFFHGSDAIEWRYLSRGLLFNISPIHCGIDIPAPQGTPVYSPCDGIVEWADVDDTMGYSVIIRATDTGPCDEELMIRFLHMSDDLEVSSDDEVSKGDLIGYVDNTGESYGYHLHVDVNDGGYTSGNAIRSHPERIIDPQVFLPQVLFNYNTYDAEDIPTPYYIYDPTLHP